MQTAAIAPGAARDTLGPGSARGMKPVRVTRLFAIVAGLAALGGAVAYACAGGDDSPAWSIAKKDYDRYGNSAALMPGNDTRVNLMLLLADRGEPLNLAPGAGPPTPFFEWAELRDRSGPKQPEDDADPSRCQTAQSGAAAFAAAVRANRSVTPAEAGALIAARNALEPTCGPTGEGAGGPPVATPAALNFVTYLEAAEDFYGGDFEAAANRYARLVGAGDPWLRETAAYMVGRNALNQAVNSAIDDYGYMERKKIDQAAVAAAGRGFGDYLRQYPGGRYAASARGLMRRVYWLAGQSGELAAEYAKMLGAGAMTRTRLVQEIDIKLLEEGQRDFADPLLLAVSDLQRMRYGPTDSWAKPITRAELESQRRHFAGHEALFDYLRAAEAYFVRKQPREVLRIIPDAARTPRSPTCSSAGRCFAARRCRRWATATRAAFSPKCSAAPASRSSAMRWSWRWR